MAEHRYGDNQTIHGTNVVNVEVDQQGQVVSVWFRCHPVPFDQTVVDKHRAAEMRSMYDDPHARACKVTAIVFDE